MAHRCIISPLVIVLILSGSFCFAQEMILFKQIDTTRLYIEVHHPEKMDSTKDYPAMVFFFGGGWKRGNRYHFLHHATYFSKRGLVCFLADYRTESRNHTTPFESLKDAKSAIRFIRKNVADFHIDPSKIIASGGSAGGHLAAATAFIDGYNDATDDLSVSCIPDALVLFNPVIDNGPGGYGYERIGNDYKNFSPLHNIRSGAPPTIFMLGTEDDLIPVETARYFKVVMEKVGSSCDLKLYEGEGHGFFNYRMHDLANYRKTVREADLFLQSLGYLEKEPVIEIGAQKDYAWGKHGKPQVNEEVRIIQHEDGTPFLWLGCTSWGMTEWLPREDVEFYLDDRKSKGMNVVQLCLFWGKRVDYPTNFTANAPNFYGHKAFLEKDGVPDPLQPAIREEGTPENPNDYWDHVDFCLHAIKERGMYAAVLPFWGRRYVNRSHPDQSFPVFTLDNIFEYGRFLGERYGNEPHIIWVNGGDVQADDNGDHLPHYRLLAEGLVMGVTGKSIKWNREAPEWDEILMTYHPSGAPMLNSSAWFHDDPWLDFNMIETHVSRDMLVAAIRQDLEKTPLKPTVMGEGHYEGITRHHAAEALHVRRQAYQTFFAGAAGHTYGGSFDQLGNGPLFSPSNNWKQLLNWEGAAQMTHLRDFLEERKWWTWEPEPEFITEGRGEGELEKLAVKAGETILVYFPDTSSCRIAPQGTLEKASWYNTETGATIENDVNTENIFFPPENLKDGVLILE